MKECFKCSSCFGDHNDLCDVDGTPLKVTIDGLPFVADRYRIDRRIGTTLSGASYLGYDLEQKRKVVLKTILFSHIASNPDTKSIFYEEVGASALIVHPNVARIYDFGESGSGYLYIVYELIEGVSLSKILKDEGAFDIDRGVRLIRQICDAIAVAHKRAKVHRNLKPSNIMVINQELGDSYEEGVKVFDFGLSKIEISDPELFKKEGYGYLPPEYYEKAEVDERTDVYSVGILLYHMLTGSLPYIAPKDNGKVSKHSLLPPRTIRPELPQFLEDLIVQAIEEKPEDRFQSIAAFSKPLHQPPPFYSNRTIGAKRVTPDINQPVNRTREISSSNLNQKRQPDFNLDSTSNLQPLSVLAAEITYSLPSNNQSSDIAKHLSVTRSSTNKITSYDTQPLMEMRLLEAESDFVESDQVPKETPLFASAPTIEHPSIAEDSMLTNTTEEPKLEESRCEKETVGMPELENVDLLQQTQPLCPEEEQQKKETGSEEVVNEDVDSSPVEKYSLPVLTTEKLAEKIAEQVAERIAGIAPTELYPKEEEIAAVRMKTEQKQKLADFSESDYFVVNSLTHSESGPLTTTTSGGFSLSKSNRRKLPPPPPHEDRPEHYQRKETSKLRVSEQLEISSKPTTETTDINKESSLTAQQQERWQKVIKPISNSDLPLPKWPFDQNNKDFGIIAGQPVIFESLNKADEIKLGLKPSTFSLAQVIYIFCDRVLPPKQLKQYRREMHNFFIVEREALAALLMVVSIMSLRKRNALKISPAVSLVPLLRKKLAIDENEKFVLQLVNGTVKPADTLERAILESMAKLNACSLQGLYLGFFEASKRRELPVAVSDFISDIVANELVGFRLMERRTRPLDSLKPGESVFTYRAIEDELTKLAPHFEEVPKFVSSLKQDSLVSIGAKKIELFEYLFDYFKEVFILNSQIFGEPA
ncbi:MAG: serine/threonine protein kinase [Blastocatellia bacterium]|nr:serine/threonine protein kinase [Blastocatellia bacterium]